MTEAIPWRVAWQQALYGPEGFYRRPEGPAGHFTTAAQSATGPVLAAALWAWADLLGADGIVDLGSGRGELLGHLYASAPGRPLTGVDVVGRPRDLPDAVAWLESPGGALLPELLSPRHALVVAHEWLDVVPCELGQVDVDRSVRQVLVDPASGAESLGGPLDDADIAWCQQFWPTVLSSEAEPGDRVEVGRQRDDAWQGLLDRLDGGAAVAIDYGHLTGSRPREGTFTAYRSGRLVQPTPDGSCDLTAHIAVDSLRQTRLLTQRDALTEVGVGATVPDHVLSQQDPAAYLNELAASSARLALRRSEGFGDFWWVVAES